MKDISSSPCRWRMRIWDVDNDEWLCENDNDVVLPYYGFDIRGGAVAAVQGMSRVYNAFVCGRAFIWEQSTGLKDKNGKEIYENDIVKVNGYGLYKVFWRKWDSSFSLEPIDVSAEVENKVLMLCEDWEDDYKVIGNIHENPDLLGGEE